MSNGLGFWGKLYWSVAMNLRECIGTTRSSPEDSLTSDISEFESWEDCLLPVIMSNVAGRILSVGTLCTGDNGKIKPNSSGIRGSPYSLVQAFPNVAPILNSINDWHALWRTCSEFVKLGSSNQRKHSILKNHPTTLRRSVTPPSATAAPKVPSGARITEAQTRRPIEPLWGEHQEKNKSGCLTAIGCTVDGYLAWGRVLVHDEKLAVERKAFREPAESWELMNGGHTQRQQNRRNNFPIKEVISCTGSISYQLQTLFSRLPPLCHSSPNSPPPLMLGTASIAP